MAKSRPSAYRGGIGLFECQSGKLLRSFVNEAPHDVYTPMQDFLWSPDGKWLLIQPMNAIVSVAGVLKQT
jgi:hypothetical protein